MEVVFTDTFFDSLKKFSKRQRWYWKIWDCLRYDIPYFLTNIYKYRKDLWRSRPWDTSGGLRLLRTNLQMVADTLEHYGHEVPESKDKKILKIKRAIELLNYHTDESFVELAEQQLGKKYSISIFSKLTEQEEADDREITLLADKLETDTWNELFEILRGQTREEVDNFYNSLTPEQKNDSQYWYKFFDGSGMKGWWD